MSSPPPTEGGRTTGLLLAAGLSTRMGSPKPLLPWDGRTLVEYQVAQLFLAGVDDVVVVTGHAAHEVAAVLRGSGARVVFNPAYAAGRAGSVRTGVAAIAEACNAIVVLGVDQPRPAAVTRAVLADHRSSGALISVASFAGKRGHPVVFDGRLLPELRAVAEETEGLRAVRRRHVDGTHDVAVDDPSVTLDLNTPDAYEAALTMFGVGRG